MGKTDPRPAEGDAGHPYLEISVEQPSGGLVVLRLNGEIDADSSRILDHWLRNRIPAESRYVVVDLTGVSMLAAVGVRVLVEHTDRQALAGRRMLTVAGNPDVQRILRLLGATKVVGEYENVPRAIAACKASGHPAQTPLPADSRCEGAADAADEVADLHQEVVTLRAALRTRPVTARALGVIQERYGLPDVDAAFGLLREAAQHHDLQVHTLARVLLATPAPRAEIWFPGRARLPAPSLSFFHQPREHKRNRAAVLGAFLDTAVGYLSTWMGDVRLVDAPGHSPRLELHRDLPPALVDHLAELDDPASAAAQAVSRGTRVVEGVPLGSEHAMLTQAGVRALQSTPLVSFDGQCVGVVTTYHSHPDFTPPRLACAKLDHIATETADWLSWHRRTVMPDALELLHRRASEYVKP